VLFPRRLAASQSVQVGIVFENSRGNFGGSLCKTCEKQKLTKRVEEWTNIMLGPGMRPQRPQPVLSATMPRNLRVFWR